MEVIGGKKCWVELSRRVGGKWRKGWFSKWVQDGNGYGSLERPRGGGMEQGQVKSLEGDGAGGGLGDGYRFKELQGTGLGCYRGRKRGSMKIEEMKIHMQ